MKIKTVTYDDLFGHEVVTKRPKPNPMAILYGELGKYRCKHCKFFHRRPIGEVMYFKCEFRGVNAIHATDHRANFPACSKFRAID